MSRTYYKWGNAPLKYCAQCEKPYWGWAANCSLSCEMEYLLEEE